MAEPQMAEPQMARLPMEPHLPRNFPSGDAFVAHPNLRHPDMYLDTFGLP